METWRNGDMRLGDSGDMDVETWTWRHGDMELKY
jgi:hypothetical protein